MFVFLGNARERRLGLSVKLPETGAIALMFPFASPTGYGLGKAGLGLARGLRRDNAPLDMLCEWIDESYRAVAPRKKASRTEAPPVSGARSPTRLAVVAPARRKSSWPIALAADVCEARRRLAGLAS